MCIILNQAMQLIKSLITIELPKSQLFEFTANVKSQYGCNILKTRYQTEFQKQIQNLQRIQMTRR
ncbi:unnamed protein product [Paramecium sonneborni]|uniref:Uncharacterized protein n=1 Tax=Paramecium sonneborni TaxID=65129 RepID=A0A8S1MXM7_9CILI|nr:unnamed protein product [Paramecium sonneborni]